MPQELNVIVDARALVGQRTGIGVHSAEIASRLDVSPPPLLASHREIADRTSIESLRFVVDRAPLGVLWQQMLLTKRAEAERAHVLWGPHGTLPLHLTIPAVATVHDLTSITMPGRHRLRTVASFNVIIGKSLEKAAVITAVSKTTADAVMMGFGVPAAKIEVIPNGVDRFFSPSDGEGDRPAGSEYLLYAGTMEPRKGLSDLVRAWSGMRRRPRLVIAGASGWRSSSLRRVVEPFVHDGSIVLAGYVDRAALRSLYRHALAFVYPSHYEGFGLPPLEAMACGAPVITTEGGALPEVVGDAAIVVRPGDPLALRSAIERVAGDASLREEMRQRGIARAAQFDWCDSANRMTEILARAAGR